jgi:YidC/Oxa1 family membrane protein insertase
MINFFKVVIYKPLFNLLVFFAWLIPGHSVGWAIIILTLVIRLALWHSSVAALRAPLQMRQHQGQLKEIQDKHKGDRNAQAQAQMAYYKEHGINPLGGCLPLLIQLPILIILYSVFKGGLGSTIPMGILYSFMPHITSLNPNFLGINLAHPDKLFILPAIAAILQYFQAKDMQVKQFGDLSKVKSDDPTVMMNKQMVYLMPVMIFIIAYRLPAGLALYYIVTTLTAWFQQYYVFKTFKPTKKATVTVRSKKG